ncbi:MAG: alanine:cation symporter family protein [Lachnospiraceae bacterium]
MSALLYLLLLFMVLSVPRAVTGGVVGSFFHQHEKGVSRGIFSNEAGLGTGSIAHACADTKKPVKQGFFGIFEVFADTIVICTLTALVILCSGTPGHLWMRLPVQNSRYQWIHRCIWQLDICFYSRCDVLFRFFYNHRMGTVRSKMYRVSAFQ